MPWPYMLFLAACIPVDLPIEPEPVEERVLVVQSEDNHSLANQYMSAHNIPPSHKVTIPITGQLYTWEETYSDYIVPLKAKLDELGPESIQYIVLFGITRLMHYKGKYADRKVSTVTLTMVAYNLLATEDNYNMNNPYWKRSCAETFIDPWTEFTHDNTPADYGLIYMVSHIDNEAQIAPVISDDGKHVIDSRYGSTGVLSGEEFDLATYPHNWKYTYRDMDKKVATCVRYFVDKGISNYLWDYENKVYGESGEEKIKALSYVGWYKVTYYDVYDWQPGSYYAQIISFSSPSRKALEHGCSYVTGPMFEPHTFGVVQPAELTYYIHEGYTYGEATLYALPNFLWAHWSSGDPLLRRGD